jgi:hypothetical protein
MKCASPPMVVVAVIIITGVVPQHSPGNSLGCFVFVSLGSWVLHFSPLSYFSQAAGAESARFAHFCPARYSLFAGRRPPWDLQTQQSAHAEKKRLRSPVCSLAHATSALGIPPGPEQGSRENGTEEEELKSFARVIFKSARRRPLKSEKVFVYFSHLCACAIVWHSFAKTLCFLKISRIYTHGARYATD